MPLETAWYQLGEALDVVLLHLRDFAAEKPIIVAADQFSARDECLLEGLLSRGWQAWSNFCRRCVVDSCMGTTARGGRAVIGLPQAATEEDVSGAALRANRKRDAYWGVPNTLLRLEPTWGDADVLTRILTRLNPANASQLLAAFSYGSASAKAMQRLRNGAAHNNTQTLSEINGMRSA